MLVILGLLYVSANQNLTIAQQRHELVKQLQTLIASQNQQVKMMHAMDALNQQVIEAEKTASSCKK